MVTTLELTQIEPNPYNEYAMEDIAGLVESIRACGLMTIPTVIGPFENGNYHLISGERRWRALSILHESEEWPDTVSVNVVGNGTMSVNEQKLLIEVANLESRRVVVTEALYRVYAVLEDMVEGGELGKRQVAAKAAKYLKISEKYSRQFQKIYLSGDEKLKELVRDGEVSVLTAFKAIRKDEKTEYDDPSQSAVERLKAGAKPKELFSVEAETPAEEPVHTVQTFSEGLESIPAENLFQSSGGNASENRSYADETRHWEKEEIPKQEAAKTPVRTEEKPAVPRTSTQKDADDLSMFMDKFDSWENDSFFPDSPGFGGFGGGSSVDAAETYDPVHHEMDYNEKLDMILDWVQSMRRQDVYSAEEEKVLRAFAEMVSECNIVFSESA